MKTQVQEQTNCWRERLGRQKAYMADRPGVHPHDPETEIVSWFFLNVETANRNRVPPTGFEPVLQA